MAHLQVVQRRIDVLQRETLPALEKASNDADIVRLRALIRDDLVVMDTHIAEMELAAEDLILDTERLDALETVRMYKESVDQYQYESVSSVRAVQGQATVNARRRLGTNHLASQRQRLLGDRMVSRDSAPKGSGDDELMNATSNVTANLRRTMQLMQQELDRSLLSHQLLEQSTNTMNLATEQHFNFAGLLSASKSIITSMERADVIDRLLIFGALLFFAAVCLYILKRRIVNKGLRAAALMGSILPGAPAKATAAITTLATMMTSPTSALLAVDLTSATLTASASPQTLVRDLTDALQETVRPVHFADEL